MTASPERILIIRFSSIGDILLTTPFIRAVRQCFPDASITFLTKQIYSDLLSENPYLTTLHTFESQNGFRALKRLKQFVREQSYDVIFDIHKNLRSIYLTNSQNARICRYSKRWFIRFLFVKFKWDLYRSRSIIPVSQLYFRAGKTYHIEDDGKGIDFFLHPHIDEKIEKLLETYNNGKHLNISIAPGAGFETKRWIPDRFAKLADALAEKYDARLFLLGGKTDMDLCRYISQNMNHSVSDFSGKLSLMETGALLKKNHLLVTNDTGLMHMASAFKLPVAAIFGSTVEEFGFYPYSTTHRVLQVGDLSCRPCSHVGRHQCPKDHFNCMRGITTKSVLEMVEELFAVNNE